MPSRTAILTVLLVAAAATAQAPAEREPIGYSGHGHLFAPNGQQIALTAQAPSLRARRKPTAPG